MARLSREWMLAEANRLIEARAKVRRPARPVWTNQIVPPERAKVDPEKVAIEGAASEVAAKLAQRDKADENARW